MSELVWWLFGAVTIAAVGGYLYTKSSEIWLKVVAVIMIIAGAAGALYILLNHFF